MSKKPGEPSPETLARANRQRIAAEEGKRAMADVEKKDLAIRSNMARLRALREAEAASRPPADPKAPRKGKAKASTRASAKKKVAPAVE